MSTQASLFETRRHDGLTRVTPAHHDEREGRGTATGQAKPDAIHAMRRIGAGTLTARYRDLLAHAARHGYSTRSGAVLRDLTDYEAARVLGVERTTINATRHALHKALVAEGGGGVVSAGRRRCLARPHAPVHAWTLDATTP